MQHSLYTNKAGRRRVFWTWFLNALMFAGMALLLFNASWLQIRMRMYRDTSLMQNAMVAVLATIGLFLLALLIHELGHLIAWRVVGLRIQQVSIGPLRAIRQGNKWQLGRVPDYLSLRGYAVAAPNRHRAEVRQQLIWFVLGGPIASLLWLICCIGAFWALRDNRVVWQEAAWLIESSLISALFGLYLLISAVTPNTIPDKPLSDGARLQMLRAGGPTAERWAALICLQGANAQGIRPRQWDAGLVHQILSIQDTTLDGLQAKMSGYVWAVDSGRERLADRILDEVMESHQMWKLGGRERFGLEKAFMCAIYTHDPIAARKWLMSVTHIARDHPLYLRAEAAVLQQEGDGVSAEVRSRKAIAQLRNDPTGIAQAEIAWLETSMIQSK